MVKCLWEKGKQYPVVLNLSMNRAIHPFSTSRQRFASTSGGLWTDVETMAGGVAYETSIRETN